MRLLVVSTMCWNEWGGSEELWAAVARAGIEAGHEVGVCVVGWKETPAKVRELGEMGARIFFRPERESGPIRRRVARFERAFGGAKRFEPDVILISQGGVHDVGTVSQGEQLRRMVEELGKPYAVLCHGNMEHWIPTEAQRRVVARFLGKAQWVGFVGRRLIEVAERQLAVKLANARVFSNPVNLADRSRLAWPMDEGTRLAVVARLDLNKGIDLLLEAMSSAQWRGREWEVDVYGEGEARGYFEELARYYGLEGRVKFKGHERDVRGIWMGHHAMVAPSRSEGVSIAVVEAMLCGRPVIATDVGGTGEWVREGETGFVAEAPMTKYVGAALERAFLARGEWEKMGEEAARVANGKVSGEPGREMLGELVGMVSG